MLRSFEELFILEPFHPKGLFPQKFALALFLIHNPRNRFLSDALFLLFNI